jgi:hypothetical protein
LIRSFPSLPENPVSVLLGSNPNQNQDQNYTVCVFEKEKMIKNPPCHYHDKSDTELMGEEVQTIKRKK